MQYVVSSGTEDMCRRCLACVTKLYVYQRFTITTRCHVSKDDPNTLRKNPAPGNHSPSHQVTKSILKGGHPKRHLPARSHIYVHSQEAIFSLSIHFATAAFVDVFQQSAPPTESKISLVFVRKTYIFLNGSI
jgi:hypothetical protein